LLRSACVLCLIYTKFPRSPRNVPIIILTHARSYAQKKVFGPPVGL
jgi:hypothetical protein